MWSKFKEAFNMIDQNRDGFIDKEDLHDMLASLGITIILD
jgi:Ca2+-binding EF-hand superfamily protein